MSLQIEVSDNWRITEETTTAVEAHSLIYENTTDNKYNEIGISVRKHKQFDEYIIEVYGKVYNKQKVIDKQFATEQNIDQVLAKMKRQVETMT